MVTRPPLPAEMAKSLLANAQLLQAPDPYEAALRALDLVEPANRGLDDLKVQYYCRVRMALGRLQRGSYDGDDEDDE
jgi:hypothetical protein